MLVTVAAANGVENTSPTASTNTAVAVSVMMTSMLVSMW